MQTKKGIIDFILNIANRYKVTDEQRIDVDILSYMIDIVAAELKVKQYIATKQIDHVWLSSPMILNFHRTNYADNQTITDDCIISKATIPQTIQLISMDANKDLGIFSLTSLSGKKNYSFDRISRWKNLPPEHTYSLMCWYDRINTDIFVNTDVDRLLLTAVLANPEDGFINNSQSIPSGSLVNGTVYRNKFSQIVYDNSVIPPNTVFTATATATFSGIGKVYLNSEVTSFRDTSPYPASGDMIRQIQIQILTTEFKIEQGELLDVRNDSVDDANKVQSV